MLANMFFIKSNGNENITVLKPSR